jgi:Protein involved in formate dehydrogenase formation
MRSQIATAPLGPASHCGAGAEKRCDDHPSARCHDSSVFRCGADTNTQVGRSEPAGHIGGLELAQQGASSGGAAGLPATGLRRSAWPRASLHLEVIATGAAYLKNRCSTCTGLPIAAILRERGHGSARSLVCGFCLSEWPALRIVCPSCGETGFRRAAGLWRGGVCRRACRRLRQLWRLYQGDRLYGQRYGVSARGRSRQPAARSVGR